MSAAGILCSFHYHQDTDLDQIPAHVPIFADSGAFSAANIGADVSLSDYSEWLYRWRHRITVAATLDVLGDPEATAANTAELAADGHDVIPVFHHGTPLPVLAELCARHRYVALGGMVARRHEQAPLMRWIAACFRVAREHGTVFHGFGQTNYQIAQALPFYSIDSSSWSSSTRWGKFQLWNDFTGAFHLLQAGQPVRDPLERAMIRTYGIEPAWLEQPGFGLRTSGRPSFREEYTGIERLSMLSYARFATWLFGRHHVAAPPGQRRPGTVLYLAAVGDQLPRMAAALSTTHAPKASQP